MVEFNQNPQLSDRVKDSHWKFMKILYSHCYCYTSPHSNIILSLCESRVHQSDQYQKPKLALSRLKIFPQRKGTNSQIHHKTIQAIYHKIQTNVRSWRRDALNAFWRNKTKFYKYCLFLNKSLHSIKLNTMKSL